MSRGYKREEYNETGKLNITAVISFIFLLFLILICLMPVVSQQEERRRVNLAGLVFF